jgi:hypothetical protein
MRSLTSTAASLLAAVSFGAALQSISIDFTALPGLPRSAVDEVVPLVSWKTIKLPDSTFLRKELDSTHLGHRARVTIDLEPDGVTVLAVGFTYHTATATDCIVGAVDALAQLERLLGEQEWVSHEAPGKGARWITKKGLAVRWGELCASGANQYYVTYAVR